MIKTIRNLNISAFISICIIFMSGCENGGDSHDFGTNDSNVVVAMGDSITALEGGNTTTYPAILASITGKTVINEGSGGATTGDGLGKIQSVLNEYHPGYVLILYGANDVIGSSGIEHAAANLRSIIVAAKNNKTVPIIATITPMYYEHEIFDGSAKALNVLIRQVASEEGCDLVDLESAFGSNTSYMNDDGLHPNDSGLNVIAKAFAGAL
jgi:lysophospholipase L1-like esterase